MDVTGWCIFAIMVFAGLIVAYGALRNAAMAHEETGRRAREKVNWIGDARRRLQQAEWEAESAHHQRMLALEDERYLLTEARARAIREGRQGFEEMFTKANNYLTLAELGAIAPDLVPPEQHKSNYLQWRVPEEPVLARMRSLPSIAGKTVMFIRSAYRIPTGGIQSVWCFDGRIIVTPLKTPAGMSRIAGPPIGAVVKQHFAPAYGERLTRLDDREVEYTVEAAIRDRLYRAVRLG